jgi:hypothetical protein
VSGARAPGKGADRSAWEAACTALAAGSPPSRFIELAEPSRAARRGVAAAISGDDDRSVALREALAVLAGGEAAADDPAEKLLRRAARRDDEAQVRRNPIVRNEAFACLHCGFEVPLVDRGPIRNHCPRCLRSAHVDGDVPGDRASSCSGVMDPVESSTRGGVLVVLHRCRRCGHERRNRLHTDRAVEPDRLDVLLDR